MRSWIVAIGGLLALGAVAASAAESAAGSLPEALMVLKAQRFVDLTHSFAPGIPHWKGAPNEREKAAKNPDYVLTVDDITAWEKRHGTIPRGAFVAMRTDWSKRWPDDAALADKDAAGVFHYPGWSKAALELLANLDQVPEAGGLVWVTTPKVEDGAGFPARVIAIVP